MTWSFMKVRDGKKPEPCNSDKCHCPDCSRALVNLRSTIREIATEVLDAKMSPGFELDRKVRGIITTERAEYRDRVEAMRARAARMASPSMLAVYPWPKNGAYAGTKLSYEWARWPNGDWQRRNKRTGEMEGAVSVGFQSRLGTTPYYVPLPTSPDSIKATADINSATVGALSKTDAKITVEGSPTASGQFMKAMFEEAEEIPAFLPNPGRWSTEIKFDAKAADVIRQSIDSARVVYQYREAFPEVHKMWTELKETMPMLNKLQAAILLHRYAAPLHTTRFTHDEQDVVISMVNDLSDQAMVDIVGHTAISGSRRAIPLYTLTERGKVWCEAVASTPLPVRTEAPWVMPAPGVRGAS